MKVLMVSKALVVGAYQRKLEELARQPGIELAAVVPPGWRDGPLGPMTVLSRTHTAGYRLIVAPLRFNGQFHLHYYPTLGRLISEWQPDVLHMDEEPYNLATWLALRTAERQAAGRVASLFFTWQNLRRDYPWPFRHFERANYKRASYAIAGNPTASKVLREKGYAGAIFVIPQFGVDPDLFSPAREDLPGQRRDFVIGYAGRLAPEKGIDLLLRACARLHGVSWSLRLLGNGPERGRLVALADQLGIAKRVSFAGWIPSTETVQHYRQMDVLVLPSVSRPNWVEQFGRVLIEAMACGVPVIGSESGEIPWVIGDAGVLFPEGDVRALADALERLAGDPEWRRELAGQGRARVLAHFTQAQVAAATAQVYRRMV